MSTSIASLATQVKNQDNHLKRILSKQKAENLTPKKLFSSIEGDSEGTNRNNVSLVHG